MKQSEIPFALAATFIISGACIVLIPLILRAVAPENWIVEMLFGGYRLFIFYTVALLLSPFIERLFLKKKNMG